MPIMVPDIVPPSDEIRAMCIAVDGSPARRASPAGGSAPAASPALSMARPGSFLGVIFGRFREMLRNGLAALDDLLRLLPILLEGGLQVLGVDPVHVGQ